MKLLTKRSKVLLHSMKKAEEKPVEKKESKDKKKYGGNAEFNNTSDEYKDLITPVELPLDENGKLVISVKRGGTYGLPKVDIRFYATTEIYTGFTKKGVNFDLDKLVDLTSLLLEVEDECDEKELFEEFKVEEDIFEEDDEEEE